MSTTWHNLKSAAAKLPGKRSPRFLAREIKAGRLKAARLGGRGEYVISDAWLDAYVESQTVMVSVSIRRRA
jgi:hypothetical protein